LKDTEVGSVALARERTSQQYIAALLRLCDGNVTRAADLAGLERESLHRLMRRYGIRSELFKPSRG
jgi:two-component system response regulator AtoC